MADGKIVKQEADYTKDVDEALPKAVALAQTGKLHEAIEELLPLEKKSRIAADVSSTSRILEGIVSLCYENKDWTALGEYVLLLSKRRAQIKTAVTKMVQKACECLEKCTDKPTMLKLIETLRVVTAGKIYVEVERARLTMKLSKIKEEEGDTVGAADVLLELQVETFSSMENKEKVEFILEQMRLGLAKQDWIKTTIISKKISISFFDAEDTQELKLRFYEMMIQISRHDKEYIETSKHYKCIFSTPIVQESEEKWKSALTSSVYYLMLGAYSMDNWNEINLMMKEDKLSQIPIVKEMLQSFITHEITQWKSFEAQYGKLLKSSDVFSGESYGKQHWDTLRLRVIEHNIRVVATYYTQVESVRLAQLLDLPHEEAEKSLSTLVTNKTIYARINRPKGIIVFEAAKDPNTVLDQWSSGINSLMALVDKTTHFITKERMTHQV